MAEQDDTMVLTFRCPAELDGLIPPPVPAALGLPDWLKAMPAQAFNALGQQETFLMTGGALPDPLLYRLGTVPLTAQATLAKLRGPSG